MAYNELIKKFDKIREYIRRFYVYGFWHRDQFDMKSARSYDNERRRVESWLSEFVTFRQEPSGKVVFLSVDNKKVLHNPLYQIFKAKSFTANDITLHFYLMDILAEGKACRLKEIEERITEDYLSEFEESLVVDESTLRKKLKEYEQYGLVKKWKEGKVVFYQREESSVDLESFEKALSFYTETDPLGVIGSFLLDKLPVTPEFYRFKHRFLLHVLDSERLCELLLTMSDKKDVKVTVKNAKGSNFVYKVHPLKIYTSTQNGRQYLLVWDDDNDRPWFYRLDNILKVEAVPGEDFGNDGYYAKKYESIKENIWGVSLAEFGELEHLEMIIRVAEQEYFILQRLEREKRNGKVEEIEPGCYRFSIDVYDARELLPWIRTFIGRIESLTCSNKEVENKFYRDFEALFEAYGGENDAI